MTPRVLTLPVRQTMLKYSECQGDRLFAIIDDVMLDQFIFGFEILWLKVHSYESFGPGTNTEAAFDLAEICGVLWKNRMRDYLL